MIKVHPSLCTHQETQAITRIVKRACTQTLTHVFALCCALLALSTISGCRVNEADLEAWSTDDFDYRRLGTYVLDAERPAELREKAFKSIIQTRDFDSLTSMIQRAPKLELKSAETTAYLSELLAERIASGLKDTDPPEVQTQSAELAFFTLESEGGREAVRKRPELIKALMNWTLSYMSTGLEVVTPSAVKKVFVTPPELLTALLYTTEGHAELQGLCLDAIKERVLKFKMRLPFALAIHNVLFTLKNPILLKGFASTFLQVLQHIYQTRPDQFDTPVWLALQQSRTLTHLKFLIELGRDERVYATPQKLSDYNIVTTRAIEGVEELNLNAELLPVIARVTASTQANANVIFQSIFWAWKLGERDLTALLSRIDPDFKQPVAAPELQNLIEQACGGILAPYKDEIQEGMIQTLKDLKKKKRLWPARLISAYCISSLYPDLFQRDLKPLLRSHYYRDKTEVNAWASETVTLGQIVKTLGSWDQR